MNLPEVIHLKETRSTITYIRELQRKQPLEDGLTVYADFQTEGRGQKSNSWQSDRHKNLMFSTILFPKNLKANQQFVLSQIVSLAVVDILSEETSGISIKWPNDIYWNEKKITGILIENDIMGDLVYLSILGVGVNLNQEVFAEDLPNPVSLKQITGKNYHIETILSNIVRRIKYYYEKLDSAETIGKIRTKYKESLFRKEGKYLFADTNGFFSAQIADVDNSGLLVLKTESGNIRKYAFKEIKYIL